jgi:hypothetical protein
MMEGQRRKKIRARNTKAFLHYFRNCFVGPVWCTKDGQFRQGDGPVVAPTRRPRW